MACTIEDITDHFDPADWDKSLGDLLLGHEGDVGQFLGSVFGFLQRKTNFFAEPGEARRRVAGALRPFAGDAGSSDGGGGGLRGGFFGAAAAKQAAAKPAAAKPTAAKPAPAAAAPPAEQQQQQTQQEAGSSVAAAAATEAAAAAPAAAAAAAAATPGPAADAEPADVELAAEKSDQESKGLKPNAGRGADLGRYSWTQNLNEVSVAVPVGPGLKARELVVVIKRQHLTVGVKGAPPIIDGILSEAVKAEDSMWNLVDGVVDLTLTKAEGMHWWRAVMTGDPEIDVQAVEPENSKLADLDPETRQTVEKMMFDQRQKALGLPTSEEMHKQEMLKRFMAAHPEMDFSNAKIM